MRSRRTGWRSWLRLNRLVPLLISVLGVGAGVAATILGDAWSQEQILGVVLIVLGLLAFDALTERLTVLEKVEQHLSMRPGGPILLPRSELPHPKAAFDHAKNIDVAAISGITLTSSYLAFFEERLSEGCQLRFLLLDPDSAATDVWRSVSKVDTAKQDISTSLQYLSDLKSKSDDLCQVRLAGTFLPFSMFAVDAGRRAGDMILELHTLRRRVDERPHLRLHKDRDERWFTFFHAQFEALWEEASPWSAPAPATPHS